MDKPTEQELRSIDRKIGEIMGLFAPIPEQLTALFEKLDVEKDTRSSEISQIKSDMRSCTERLQVMADDFAACGGRSQICKIESHDEVVRVKDELHLLADSMKDVVRILRLDEGESEWTEDIENRVMVAEATIKEATQSKRSTKAILKVVLEKAITIGGSVLLAYLLIRFGLS